MSEHITIESRVQDLEGWRTLIVDPTLKDYSGRLDGHDTKIEAFERIEAQITGVVQFIKIVAGSVGLVAAVCEILRALTVFLRK